jgi:hypothetical protein
MTRGGLQYEGMPVGEPLQFQVTAKEVILPGGYGQCVLRDPNASEANSTTTINVEDIHRENCILSRERFPVLFDPDSGKYIPMGSRGLTQRAVVKNKISKGKAGMATLLRAKNGQNAGKVEVVDIEFISTTDLEPETPIWIVWKKDFARHGANQANGEAPSSFGMWCQLSSGGAGEGQLIDTLNDTNYSNGPMRFTSAQEDCFRLLTHQAWVSGHNNGWWGSESPLCDRYGTYHVIVPLEYHIEEPQFAEDKIWEDKAGTYDLTARYYGSPKLVVSLWISAAGADASAGQCLSSVTLGGQLGTQIVRKSTTEDLGAETVGLYTPKSGVLGSKTDTATLNVVFNLSENDTPFGPGSSRDDLSGYHLWLCGNQQEFDFNTLDAGRHGSFLSSATKNGEAKGRLELGHSYDNSEFRTEIPNHTEFSLTYYSDPGHPNLVGLGSLN